MINQERKIEFARTNIYEHRRKQRPGWSGGGVCELRGNGFCSVFTGDFNLLNSNYPFLTWGKFLNVVTVSDTLGQWKEGKVGV